MDKLIEGKKVEAIRKLCEEDEIAKRFLAMLSGLQRDSKETTVERAATLVHADQHEIRGVFQKLQGIGIGKLLTGRRGYKTRFVWDYSRRSIGRISERKSDYLESIDEELIEAPEDDPTIVSQPDAGDVDVEGFIKHVYQLRTDLQARITLPADLTSREAERVAAWVRTLPFE